MRKVPDIGIGGRKNRVIPEWLIIQLLEEGKEDFLKMMLCERLSLENIRRDGKYCVICGATKGLLLCDNNKHEICLECATRIREEIGEYVHKDKEKMKRVNIAMMQQAIEERVYLIP